MDLRHPLRDHDCGVSVCVVSATPQAIKLFGRDSSNAHIRLLAHEESTATARALADFGRRTGLRLRWRRRVYPAPPFFAVLRDLRANIHGLWACVRDFAHLRTIFRTHLRAVATDLRQHCIRRRAPPERTQRCIVSVNGGVLREEAAERLRVAALNKDRLIARVKPELEALVTDKHIRIGVTAIIAERSLRGGVRA